MNEGDWPRSPAAAVSLTISPPAHRIVVLGAHNVGKSCLVTRYVQNKFNPYHEPTIEDNYLINMSLDGRNQKTEILDTAGMDVHLRASEPELFDSAVLLVQSNTLGRNDSFFDELKDLYLRRGHAFVLVYDVTSKSSFDDAMQLRGDIARCRGMDEVPVVLVGNKIDVPEEEREVDIALAQRVAQSWQCPHLLVSAKTGQNVNEPFEVALRQRIHRQRRPPPTRAKSRLRSLHDHCCVS
eukprot:m.4310 g.4310  ORF g.4310 m.4310 type:complete len:239 (-) comp4245_c0_seq1:73-789(-)